MMMVYGYNVVRTGNRNVFVCKCRGIFTRAVSKPLPSTKATTESATKHLTTQIHRKSVFISTSRDIYTNLALEDWLYTNYDFTNHQMLMLWQNDPCVVIGRHQNPWLEANVAHLPTIAGGTKLARRNSGGGTVYHDGGNLNLTFFTARDEYKRRSNLDVIVRAIEREYGLGVEVTKREDLAVGGRKISGTAAKLGRSNAYHHCTLLVDVNRSDLSKALLVDFCDVQTHATKSIKSEISNLSEIVPEVTLKKLEKIIAREYLESTLEIPKVDPIEEIYPKINFIAQNLKSWDWIYGKTPKFSIVKKIEDLEINFDVEKGLINQISFVIPRNFANFAFVDEILKLKGCKYDECFMSFVDRLLSDKERVVIDN